MYFVNCMRILQQGCTLLFFFVLSFALIAPTKFNILKDLSIDSKNIQTQNCAPIQCKL